MATLPIMNAGLPSMDGMQQAEQTPMLDLPQPMTQGAQSLQQQPDFLADQQQPLDPQSQSIDNLLSAITPILDSRASASLIDDMEQGFANKTYNPQSMTDKAVKKSFTFGIKDLSDLLSKGQHSDEYFGKAGSTSLQSAADAYASLSSFMKATTPTKQSEAITSFRADLKKLTSISERLINITDRNRQSHFLQDMQASNDTVVNQIIGDATSQTDNGSAAYEYLITGKVAQGTPLPMIQNQSTKLWQAISKTLADNINNQLIALFQQSLAGMLRSESLSQSMTPEGMMDQQMFGQNIMNNIQSTQNKVAQIQQIVDATFSPAEQAKIHQPQQHPINQTSIKHYSR